MDERPDTAARPDDRQPALPHELYEVAVEGESDAGSVEVSEAEGQTLQSFRADDSVLLITNRFKRPALIRWRLRIEWVLLALRTIPAAFVVPVAEALHDQTASVGRPCGFEQMIEPLGSQPVRQRKLVVEPPKALDAGETSHLMDNDLGPRTRDRLHDRGPVETVRDDRLRAERTQPIHLLRGARHRRYLESARNEERHESLADRTRGACDKDLHALLLPCTSFQYDSAL